MILIRTWRSTDEKAGSLLSNLESASQMTLYWRLKCMFLEGLGGDVKICASLNKVASRFCYPYLRLSQQARLSQLQTLLKFACVMTGFFFVFGFCPEKVGSSYQ